MKRQKFAKELLITSLKEKQDILNDKSNQILISNKLKEKINQLTSIVSERDSTIKTYAISNNKGKDEIVKLKTEKEELNQRITKLKNEVIRLNSLTWLDKLRGKK